MGLMGWAIVSLASSFLISDVESVVEGCEEPNQNKWIFVGCSYSPYECYYSCANLGHYKAERDKNQCLSPGLDWACYCPSLSDEAESHSKVRQTDALF